MHHIMGELFTFMSTSLTYRSGSLRARTRYPLHVQKSKTIIRQSEGIVLVSTQFARFGTSFCYGTDQVSSARRSRFTVGYVDQDPLIISFPSKKITFYLAYYTTITSPSTMEYHPTLLARPEATTPSGSHHGSTIGLPRGHPQSFARRSSLRRLPSQGPREMKNYPPGCSSTPLPPRPPSGHSCYSMPSSDGCQPANMPQRPTLDRVPKKSFHGRRDSSRHGDLTRAPSSLHRRDSSRRGDLIDERPDLRRAPSVVPPPSQDDLMERAPVRRAASLRQEFPPSADVVKEVSMSFRNIFTKAPPPKEEKVYTLERTLSFPMLLGFSRRVDKVPSFPFTPEDPGKYHRKPSPFLFCLHRSIQSCPLILLSLFPTFVDR
jgi:hypothetical protein